MFVLLSLLGLAALGWAYGVALSDPVVRRAQVALPGLPPGHRILVALLSDLHVAGPDMPPERLARIVAQVNGLQPDLVLLAGDFVSDKRLSTRRYEAADAIAPLAGLRARLGSFAVLGNHDHWRDSAAMVGALRGIGIPVLGNDAARAGPLAIGGLDDDFTGRADPVATLRHMAAIGGVPIVLSHSPDPFAELPATVPLMVAGHTHCGQIRLPLVGALATASEHGERYECGLIRENGKILVVSAGLGTSVLPLRLGAVPDLWLLTLEGPRAER